MNGGLWGSIPLRGSEIAARWDSLYSFLVWLSVFMLVLVVGPIVYFSWKYRERPGRRAEDVEDNVILEFLWTAIPTVLVVGIFAWGWVVYRDMMTGPQDAMEVKVIAQSWKFSFQYDDGRQSDWLVVPVNKPVRLRMTSIPGDVLHNFSIPNFRIKQDVVPGIYTYQNFTATVVGQHQVFCTQYCGAGHSLMLTKLIVVPEDQFTLWKWGKDIELPPTVGVGATEKVTSTGMKSFFNPEPSQEESAAKTATLPSAKSGAKTEEGAKTSTDLIAKGKQLSMTKGCIACHTADGKKGIGPTWFGIWGHEVSLQDGSTSKVDENYVRQSLEKPQAKIVKGYASVVMPSYAGQMKEEDYEALFAYLKSLK